MGAAPARAPASRAKRQRGRTRLAGLTGLTDEGELLHCESVTVQKRSGRESHLDVTLKEGKNKEALDNMNLSADMEDKTEKHPVTPGEVLPARELLADMLMQMNKPAQALEMYEANLKTRPNRRNSIYGAWAAAAASGKKESAKIYAKQFQDITGKDISASSRLISAVTIPTIN